LAQRAVDAILVNTFARIEDVPASIKFFDWLLAGALAWPMAAVSHDAVLAGCKPDHFKRPFFVKSMGVCGFDPETLSYAGTPVQQAMCLMRGMDVSRNLLPRLSSLPAPLASRIGQTTGLPSRATLSNYLAQQGLEGDLGDYLWLPVSRAHNNDLDSPMARYFVIHDTSGPNYGHRPFPDDIDESPKLNDLRNFYCPDGWGKAHVFISRTGELLVGHDYSIAWRETKFEQAAEFGGALQGLFLHNELIQPRGSVPGHRNDARTPDPAFTPAQYDRLALVYVIASVRAERWLVPAFHAAIDAQIPNGHDDPLNFDIDSFARSLDSLMVKLGSTAALITSGAVNAQERPTQEQPKQTQPQLQHAPTIATVPTSPKLAPVIASWQQALATRLARFQRYPAQAKGATGVVNVSFSIDRQGHVLNGRVTKSSGSAVLDTEALSLLTRAAPLPPPPAAAPDSDLTFVLPIRFALR
jgi:TonB family protein